MASRLFIHISFLINPTAGCLLGLWWLGIVSCIVSLRTRRVKQSLKNEIASLKTKSDARNDTVWGLLTLGILAVPLTISAYHYPLGGWDAWSCWNLKAKFIFLGGGHWKDMFLPGLWRSNTHYPLLWPLINVWFWDLGGQFNQAVPMFNSILFALLTAGILLFGLLELTGMLSDFHRRSRDRDSFAFRCHAEYKPI